MEVGLSKQDRFSKVISQFDLGNTGKSPYGRYGFLKTTYLADIPDLMMTITRRLEWFSNAMTYMF